MTQLSIKQRYKPFSHRPGVKVLLPGTEKLFQCFPAKIVGEEEIPLPVVAPIQGFSVVQDLEKGRILIFGRSQKGHFSYTIENEAENIPTERLALGVHKKQEIERVYQRKDLKELLPLLFHVSQYYLGPFIPPEGSLLQEAFHAHEALFPLIETGFTDLFVPQKIDTNYLGYRLPPLGASEDPFLLLRAMHPLIRSLFFHEEPGHLSFLTKSYKEFLFGKFLNFRFSHGTVDAEWSKGKPRRIFIRLKTPSTCSLSFGGAVKKFRVRRLSERKGHLLAVGQEMDFQEGSYLLDRFST